MAVERNITIDGAEYFVPVPVAEAIDRWQERETWDRESRERQGVVESLCKEIGYRFDKRMENVPTLVAFVRVLVGHVAHMRSFQDQVAKITGKLPSAESAEVLRRVEEMLAEVDRAALIGKAAAVHDYIHEVAPDDAYPCDHLIDMLSSCVSAIRFGLERPHMSRHAAAAAQHVWKQLYGVGLFDSCTPAWENDWARQQMQYAILSQIQLVR